MTNKRRGILFFLIALLAVGLWACGGTSVGNYETPDYTVEKAEKPFEIRSYPALLVAEVVTQGDRKEAIGDGFRALADFIFGNNAPGGKISMTTPVVQEKGGNISMTTPVVQESSSDGWKTRFVMPREYTLATLPKPNNEAIKIYETQPKRYAVIRFSGLISEANVKSHEDKLRAYVAASGLKVMPGVTYAYYDPPWTLPFFRRNEAMLELAN